MAFTIKTVTDFAAAHSLRGYDGPCQRLHGHNWKIEVEVQAETLDSVGMTMDFKVLKKYTKEVIDRLDHYNLNDIPPFDVINPTAENLTKYFYDEIAALIKGDAVSMKSVTIWETERACARYEA